MEKLNLRYGENPHQSATFTGNLGEIFTHHLGKDLSYNNLVDIDAAVNLCQEFRDTDPTFIIIKHTNSCGVCTRPTVEEAWLGALSCDPTSAFGGVFICNSKVDLPTAIKINSLFYEVLIAVDYDQDAWNLLTSKRARIVIKLKKWLDQSIQQKTILNGVLEQTVDSKTDRKRDFTQITDKPLSQEQEDDLIFALKCTKHLKSNSIAIVKNKQLIGMGCGQTSRVDALKQAISKSKQFGFELTDSVMSSEAFFPFKDCVEIAKSEGILAVAQPGGSKNDNESIEFCNENGMSMVFTGTRHFKH